MLSRRRLLASFPAVLFASVLSKDSVNHFSPFPTPRFRIGQQVKAWYDLEDFPELIEVTGTIKGLCWQPEDWRIKVGWVYQVYFPPHPLLDNDFWLDEIPEFDLEAL